MNEFDKIKECPICGGKEFGEGKLSGYTKMMPINKIISNGSDMTADICLNCGHIVSMKVLKPEKFK